MSPPSSRGERDRARPGTTWIDSGDVTANAVDSLLKTSVGYRTESSSGPLRVLFTDAGTRLKEVGSRFLGEKLEAVELVEL